MLDPKLKDQIQLLVCDLARGAYAEVEARGGAGRLNGRVLRRAVEDYGRQLVPIPEEGWALVDAYKRNGPRQLVDVPLWTKEEGRSDLTLSVEANWVNGEPVLSVTDLHVM